ncbi:hypothetical protein HMPREF9073_02933 [Capnocytophaga sp. oral taxon 326 str. F0382]|nr:hypothetical protein HMPREF9073_02933 [Capnocytophaga sp. oral taxon 326 str. F0382]
MFILKNQRQKYEIFTFFTTFVRTNTDKQWKYISNAYMKKTDPNDGFRVLADRLWPRGIKKEALALDLWAKEIAPSTELRKRYHQDGDFDAFKKDYTEELKHNVDFPAFCETLKAHKMVTLLTASKEIDRSALPILLSQIS